MTKGTPPESWQAPSWHPDCGDAEFELDHLRATALKLLELSPSLSIVLEVPEPGLMYLEVLLQGGARVEVHSVAPDVGKAVPRYGIFIFVDTSEETELYAESPDGAAELIAKHCLGG